MTQNMTQKTTRFFSSLFLATLLIASLTSTNGRTANAAPQPELWDFWSASGDSTAAPSHAPWDAFLKKYLSVKDGVAVLDYAGVNADDTAALRDYIDALAAAPVRELPRQEQLAYWINLYNALTVQTILANYPVDSIKEISEGFFDSGPWDMKLLTIDGKELSLNDIEHRILRPLWKDPRIHYAVNCASIGCPNLATSAYTADNVEAMLEKAAAAYINHPRGAKVQDGKLIVSSIYEWFAQDFGSNDAEIIAHLNQYATPKLQTQLADIKEISGDDYDWSLNKK